MSRSIDLFNQGELPAAVAAAVEGVRDAPTDRIARLDLATLLAFEGEFERAEKHVSVALQQAEGEQDTASLQSALALRNLLRGEVARRQVFDEGVVPNVIGSFTDEMQQALRALVALRDGNRQLAAQCVAANNDRDVARPGKLDEAPFNRFRVKDGVTGPFFEVIGGDGAYYWVALDEVKEIDFDPIEQVQDLLWRHVQLLNRAGEPVWCFFPVRYYGSTLHEDSAIRSSRASEWHDVETLERGLGVRFFECDGKGVPLLDVSSLSFTLAE